MTLIDGAATDSFPFCSDKMGRHHPAMHFLNTRHHFPLGCGVRAMEEWEDYIPTVNTSPRVLVAGCCGFGHKAFH